MQFYILMTANSTNWHLFKEFHNPVYVHKVNGIFIQPLCLLRQSGILLLWFFWPLSNSNNIFNIKMTMLAKWRNVLCLSFSDWVTLYSSFKVRPCNNSTVATSGSYSIVAQWFLFPHHHSVTWLRSNGMRGAGDDKHVFACSLLVLLLWLSL